MDRSCWKLRNESVNIAYFIFQVIRRRIVLPASLENETPPLKVTLSKRNRKDGMYRIIFQQYSKFLKSRISLFKALLSYQSH